MSQATDAIRKHLEAALSTSLCWRDRSEGGLSTDLRVEAGQCHLELRSVRDSVRQALQIIDRQGWSPSSPVTPAGKQVEIDQLYKKLARIGKTAACWYCARGMRPAKCLPVVVNESYREGEAFYHGEILCGASGLHEILARIREVRFGPPKVATVSGLVEKQGE